MSKDFEVLLVSSAKDVVLVMKRGSISLVSSCTSCLPPQTPVCSEGCFRKPDLFSHTLVFGNGVMHF